jgi:streptomycin 6-kinase
VSRRNIEVPPEVRRKALAHGQEGRRWLAGLAGLVAELEREWGLVVGSTLRGGSESFAAEATTAEGDPAVIKIIAPGARVSHEIETLAHAGGRGYVRLLRHDSARRAMLQERLGQSLAQLGLSVPRQLAVICGTLRVAWEVPALPGFQSGADKATWLADSIRVGWDELGQPCSQEAVEVALAFAESRRRAFDPANAVLVHGDAHAANTLRAPRGGFKLIDPDGLFAERAYDLAIPMREYGRELLKAPDPLRAARAHCATLGALAGADAEAVWEWGLLERVSTGLVLVRVGREELARDMLAVAELIARAPRRAV